jgi:hypothetical protein
MRFECLVGFGGFIRDAGRNDKAERELAGRLRNDIMQDRSLLEGASMARVGRLPSQRVHAIHSSSLSTTKS